MTKIRVTIDLDEAPTSISNWAEEHTDTYRNGILGVDKEGVYHMYYKSRSNLIEFEDMQIECPSCLHGLRRDVGPNGEDEDCTTCDATGFVNAN